MSRLSQLENTVLELGTELFRLKQRLVGYADTAEQLMQTMSGLKQLLDEKGVITSEDFEAAIDFSKASAQIQQTAATDISPEGASGKKIAH